MKNNIDDLGVCGIVVDDWAIDKSFKPKTITTDYNSWICYISRRAVPPNIPITDAYYWKPITRLQSNLAFDYIEFKAYVERRLKTMDVKIESFLRSVAGGTALTDQFGDSELVAVNQKVHTNAINKIYEILENITGDVYTGMQMLVTPEYYMGKNGCDISIRATTADTNGIFERIDFYINDVHVAGAENTNVFNYNTSIEGTSTVKCVAKILGIEYVREKVINCYRGYEFWFGAGFSYTDIMNDEHLILGDDDNMRKSYDVTVHQGERIIIVISDEYKDKFIRADLNSVEIPFTESEITVDNKTYKVYTSDPWVAGDYNIDING